MIKIVVFIASLFTIDLTGQPIKIRISNPYENYGKMKATTITVAIVTDKLPYSRPGIHGTMLQLSLDIHIELCRFHDYYHRLLHLRVLSSPVNIFNWNGENEASKSLTLVDDAHRSRESCPGLEICVRFRIKT